MEKVEAMTPEQKRTEIAYKRQSLKELHGNIPEKQYKEQKEIVNNEIKELGGMDHDNTAGRSEQTTCT